MSDDIFKSEDCEPAIAGLTDILFGAAIDNEGI